MEHLMGRYRNVSILAAAIFLQIVGLAVQVKRRSENHSTRLIRVWTVAAVTPLEKGINRIQSGTSDIWHNYIYLRGVRQQNRDLQEQIQQLQLEQVRLRQDAEQARRLQALLGFKEQYIDKTVAAQVIGASGSEQSRLVYLDKGTADGLAPDMAVISQQGAVGKVVQVFRHTAQVLLINDQNSGVGTILERSRLQGVLKGRATGELVLDKIMAEEDVQQGDRVLTSGGDQIFPKGLPVGTVGKVNRGKEFLEVTVRPAASLNHLEEVLVITKKQEREPAAVANSEQVRAADILAQRLPSVPDKPAPGPAATVPPGNTAPKTLTKPAVGTGAPQNAAASSMGTKPQMAVTTPKPPSTTVPRTQPVDFVRPNGAASANVDALKPTTPKAAVTTSSTDVSVAGQNKTQSTSATAQQNTTNPAASPAKNPNGVANVPAGVNSKPVVGATAVKSASVAKSTPAGTQQMQTSKPGNATNSKTTQQSLKPAPPGSSKPTANTPQPSTQPDSGGTPQ
jgi:rod shape-determining protein MreC